MMKYKDWIKEWLENYVKPSLKQRTYIRYSEIVFEHIISHLGEYNIEEIKPLRLQRYTRKLLQKGNQRTGKGLSANSVNGIIKERVCGRQNQETEGTEKTSDMFYQTRTKSHRTRNLQKR